MSERLTEHEKDLLLSTIAHHMDQRMRALIMATLPQAYNRWMQRNIVEVRRICDGTRIAPDRDPDTVEVRIAIK